MGLRKPENSKVEVDMVPLIYVVVLNLLFIIIVGDITQSVSSVKMKLPKSDQAQTEESLGLITNGRIVVQISKRDNKYVALVDGSQPYEINQASTNLVDNLKEQAKRRAAEGKAKIAEDGKVDYPVKMRIPVDCPMFWVQVVTLQLAKAGLQNVHYAADSHKE